MLRSALAISAAGDWIYRFAVPTLILHLTGSAVATGLAYVLEFLPYVVLGPFAGVLADRRSRRGLMVGCDLVSCVIALVIAALARRPDPPVWGLYACAVGLAAVRPLHFPAFQGFLAETISPEARPRFNAWTQLTDSTLGLAGPVAGAAIVAAAGPAGAIVIDAVSFAVSAVLVAMMAGRRPAGPRAGDGGPPRGLLRDLRDGGRSIVASRAVRAGVVLITGANLAAYVIEGNLVFLILSIQHQPKVALGVILGAQGLGGALGAVAAPRLLAGRPASWLIGAGMGLSAVAMLIPVALPYWTAIAVSQGIEGGATALVIVCWFAVLPSLVPADIIGRFVATGRAIAYLTIPAGTLAGAWLISASGSVRILFAGAALLQLAIFGAAVSSPLHGAAPRTGPAAPGRPAPGDSEPAT